MQRPDKAQELRYRLLQPQVIRVAGAHDALAALVAEQVGLDALNRVLDAGSSVPIEEEIAPICDIFRLQRVDEWLALES